MFAKVHWAWWVTALFLLAIAAGILSGCSTGDLSFAKAEARDLAAEIEQAKVEMAELQAEAQAAVTAAQSDPTPEKVEKADEATTALQEKARATAKKMVELESLIGRIDAARLADAEALAAAKEAAEFLPSPWREVALMVGTLGVTLWTSFGHTKTLVSKEREIGKSVVRSLDTVGLTEVQRDLIKQGPAAKALVDEAQGRV